MHELVGRLSEVRSLEVVEARARLVQRLDSLEQEARDTEVQQPYPRLVLVLVLVLSRRAQLCIRSCVRVTMLSDALRAVCVRVRVLCRT